MELIDRKALIDEIAKIAKRLDNLDTINGLCGAVATAMELPTINQWNLVTEKLPDKPYGCIVTVMDTNPMTFDEFENIYPNFVGWDGENWNDDDGHSIPFEVIAWMPLPIPYKGVEE